MRRLGRKSASKTCNGRLEEPEVYLTEESRASKESVGLRRTAKKPKERLLFVSRDLLHLERFSIIFSLFFKVQQILK